jgi:hypothetical protein
MWWYYNKRMEKRLTADNFDSTIREKLRYRHEFGHEDLERAKGIVGNAVAHVQEKMDTKRGMAGQHFDTAMEYLHKHDEGWKKLPEHHREAIEATLRGHFGLDTPET